MSNHLRGLLWVVVQESQLLQPGFYLFSVCYFSPLLAVVTSQVTAPALIIVGVLMAQSLSKIKWNEMEIAIPSFLILLGMPLTYSISDGIALGFIFYQLQ